MTGQDAEIIEATSDLEKELESLSKMEETEVNDPVRMYLREIGQVPLLHPEDEVVLARAILDGKAAQKCLAADGDLPPEIDSLTLSYNVMRFQGGPLAAAQ